MNDDICICSENNRLFQVRIKISYDWEMRFVGRKVNRETYDKLFDKDGHDFESFEYWRDEITLNLNPSLDADGYITSVDSFKSKCLYGGHGRPVTEDRLITRSEKVTMSNLLDSVIENPVERDYEILCESFQFQEILPGGYRFKNVTKTGISLFNSEGTTVSLTKAKIIKALCISHEFIDVLYSKDALLEAPELFSISDVPLYLSILSKVDYHEYHNIDKLMEEANERDLIFKSKTGYQSLLDAVQENDIEKAKNYIEFAKIVFTKKSNQVEPPLLIAVRNNNTQIVRILLENGAYAAETYIESNDQPTSPILQAVRNGNYEIVKLLATYHGAEPNQGNSFYYIDGSKQVFNIIDFYSYIASIDDYEAIKMVLPHVSKTAFNSRLLSSPTKERINELAAITGARIAWSLELFSLAYYQNRDLSLAMLKQMSNLEAIDYLIQVKDFELFSFYIDKQRYISPRSSFETAYQLGKKWYIKLMQHTNPQYEHIEIRNHRDRFLAKCILNEEYDKYVSVTQSLGIGVPLGSLFAFKVFPDDKPFSMVLNLFLRFLLERIEYVENIKGSNVEDLYFRSFTKEIFRYGTEDLCIDYLTKYPLLLCYDFKYYLELCLVVIVHRNDNVLTELLQTKLKNEANVDEKNYIFWKVLYLIILEYAKLETELVKDHRTEKNENKRGSLYDSLCQVATITSLSSLTDHMLAFSNRPHSNTKTIYSFAKACGIKNDEFLALLKS